MGERRQAPPRAGERLADAVVHVLGLGLGVGGAAGLGALALPRADATLLLALGLYAGGMLCMFGCSAAYNLSRPSERSELLRRLDHAAIFLMIAGSYTPFALIALGGAWGWALFAFVWSGAAIGAALKLICGRCFERSSIVVYLLLGWSVLAAIQPLSEALSRAGLILLASGGALYTTGVIFHLWKGLRFQSAIWHAFVLAGAICHFAAIVGEVAVA